MLNQIENLTQKIEDLETKAYTGSDLGMHFADGVYTFKVWSPHAKNVSLNLYETGILNDESLIEQFSMKHDNNVWSIAIEKDLDGLFYTYEFNHGEQVTQAPDLYSKAMGLNGDRTAIINLTDTNPEGWEHDQHVMQDHITDAIIWEVHVEDFSSDAASGIRPEYQGKYLGFTEENTTLYNAGEFPTGLNYLSQLNINYVHLLPVYDFVNDEEDITYNWGYDPKNYMVPEGKYSSNPRDPKARIHELKQLIQSLHTHEIGVIMDVVYNHTYEDKNSWFELTVPDYYYRKQEDGTFSNGSGVGNETASERKMMRKYMIDSLIYWVEEYHIDGFRFDLMGVHDTETMNDIRKELDARGYEKVILYGEPWSGGPLALKRPYKPANKGNIQDFSKRIAVFNEEFRDSIKGDVFVDHIGGFLQGANRESYSNYSNNDLIAAIMANTQTDTGEYQLSEEKAWARVPTEVITYSSSHDNLTLNDKLKITIEDEKFQARDEKIVAMNKINAAILFTAQGGVFYQAGEEFSRTKFGNPNSYNASIAINHLDWSRAKEFKDLVAYYQGMAEIRKKYKPLRDYTTNTAAAMHFSDLPENLILYSIPNLIDENSAWKNLIVAANTTEQPQVVDLPTSENGNSQKWTVLADTHQVNPEGIGSIHSDSIILNPKELYILALENV